MAVAVPVQTLHKLLRFQQDEDLQVCLWHVLSLPVTDLQGHPVQIVGQVEGHFGLDQLLALGARPIVQVGHVGQTVSAVARPLGRIHHGQAAQQ
jgi:hypothetical protein